MKKTGYYETVYRKNDATGRVIIDVALDDYLDFFHEWDNASFKRRDIHSELASFLDLCSEDIPIQKKLEIILTLKTNEISEEKENSIRTSYHNYYNSLRRLENRKFKRFIRISVILLLTSAILLTSYGLLAEYREHSIFSKVLLESLLIGGWVFTWEAVHMLFLDIIEPFRTRREIKRFLKAELYFKYLS